MNQKNAPSFIKNGHLTPFSGKLGPTQILVIGFLTVIAIGTSLLMLPMSTMDGTGTSLIDALFTATSAVCVTGLVVFNTLSYWSDFGKGVILFLIQIGGLGFATLVSMLFIAMGRKITLKNRLLMQEALNFSTTAGIVRFTKTIVGLTFLLEGIGAILLSIAFIPRYGPGKGIWYAIFHSISAFCNAGFDIIGDNSFTPYVGSTLINLTLMFLIIGGGLGFSVWVDTIKVIKDKWKAAEHFTWKQAFYKLSLHTKLVWVITLFLILVGFIFFFIAEYANPYTLAELSLKEQLYGALFQSVTARTAGFNTISQGDLTVPSKVFMMILMFIGGSPAGTAGGVKTVTIGVLILSAICTIQGKEEVVTFKRKIPTQVILRALTIIMISIAIVITMLMVLTITENAEFIDIMYEVISAFATVGVSTGLTPYLSFGGKIAIIILMFIGRLGPITIAIALMLKQARVNGTVQYPEEKIMVG